jgi:hypothetical protein
MNKPLDESRCCKRVWREWDSVQCDRAGKYEHEGKKYCKQHHPETIAAAKKAKTASLKSILSAVIKQRRSKGSDSS